MSALVIETSSLKALIGLLDKKRFVELIPLTGNSELSKMLLPSLKKLFTQLHLDYIAVGTGPGSFTGTRVGATVAQTLSFALGIPLIGFPSSLAGDLPVLADYLHKTWLKREFRPLELAYPALR